MSGLVALLNPDPTPDPNPDPTPNPTPDPIPEPSGITIEYPVKWAYINLLKSWSSAAGIAESIGLPGYSTHNFNYIAYSFFTCHNGPVDIAKFWDNPITYMGSTAEFGSTDAEIRTNILNKYHEKGIKLIVSVFGAT